MENRYFRKVINFDPNQVGGSLASRLGFRAVNSSWDISSTYYAPYYRIMPVYDAQADTLSQLFYIGINANWIYGTWYWNSGIMLGYSDPSTPSNAKRIETHVFGNSSGTFRNDEIAGTNYNSVLRVSLGANSYRWLNSRYPVRSSIWYTNNIRRIFSILNENDEYFGLSSFPPAMPWVSDCSLSPLIWNKRPWAKAITNEPLSFTLGDTASGGPIGRKAFYAMAYEYDGYQHSTMIEDSTGVIYVGNILTSNNRKYVTVRVSIDPFRVQRTLNAFHSNTDSLGTVDYRVTGIVLYKNEVSYGDSAVEKFGLEHYKKVTTIDAFDKAWIYSGSSYYDFVDSTDYDVLSENYYDVIGHYSDYDIAVYAHSAILNGRRYCAVVKKPTKSGDIFSNSDRVYYNPLQTHTDPPSYALDSFPDDHYISLPENNAVITGMFAFTNRLFVSSRTGVYRITPGIDAHDFSVEYVYGSYPIDNPRTVQVTPDGVFYKTESSAAYFDGVNSAIIGDALRQADSLAYDKNAVSGAFESWYDSQKKEYWMFHSDHAYIFSTGIGSWRKYTFSLSDGSDREYIVRDVAGMAKDSLYVLGSNSDAAEQRMIWNYPSDSVYTYVDGDTSVTVLKELETGRITQGSAWAEKDYKWYGVNASLASPIPTRSDSFFVVAIYIDNEIAQRDTFRFTGQRISDNAISFGAGRDIKFNISSTNMNFTLHSLEYLWDAIQGIPRQMP